MVTYEEAYRIAQSANPYGNTPIVGASKTADGWIFDLEQQIDKDGLPAPGGPSPLFVSSINGDVKEVYLPSGEGFEILESITEEDIPLPN